MLFNSLIRNNSMQFRFVVSLLALELNKCLELKPYLKKIKVALPSCIVSEGLS